jgi:hypothetical protein
MRAAVGFISVFIFLFFASSVFAASQLSVDNLPLTIDQLQEFEVDINFSCLGCTDSYLRGVFYPSGSSYFGYTQDNIGNWSNSPGGNCATYFKVNKADLTVEGTWSGKLKFKPDKDSSYYSGPGEYLFKVGRYTPSCSSPSVWSQESTIAITGPSSTPTPNPTLTPTNAPAPTSSPTSTPAPTKVPTTTPTPTTSALKPTASPTQEDDSSGSVLGENTGSDLGISPPEDNPVQDSTKKPDTLFQVFSIILGIALIAACGILIFRVIKKGELVKNEEE